MLHLVVLHVPPVVQLVKDAKLIDELLVLWKQNGQRQKPIFVR